MHGSFFESTLTDRMKPQLAIIAVIAVALVGIVPSGATQWYQQFHLFDKIMHFAGGFVIAWFVATLMKRSAFRDAPVRAILWIIAWTVIVGILWEIAEYLSNVFFADAPAGTLKATIWRYYHGGDMRDTILDIVADTLGALALIGIYVPLARRKK